MYWLLLHDARQLANTANRYGSTPVLCASIIGGSIGSDMVALFMTGAEVRFRVGVGVRLLWPWGRIRVGDSSLLFCSGNQDSVCGLPPGEDALRAWG